MSKACPKCAHELAAVAPSAYRCPSCAGMWDTSAGRRHCHSCARPAAT